MADTIVGGLFGIDPYQRQQEQAKLLNTQAQQFAELDPFQKANYALYSGGAKLGNLGAGLMGAQDPQLMAQQTAQQLASQFDMTSPQGLKDYSAALLKAGQEANNPTLSNFGMMALDKARQAEVSQLNIEKDKLGLRKDEAVLAKMELSAAAEEKLRKELTDLGPNASEQDVIKVVSKYGSPDKILQVLTASQDRKAKLAAAQAETGGVSAGPVGKTGSYRDVTGVIHGSGAMKVINQEFTTNQKLLNMLNNITESDVKDAESIIDWTTKEGVTKAAGAKLSPKTVSAQSKIAAGQLLKQIESLPPGSASNADMVAAMKDFPGYGDAQALTAWVNRTKQLVEKNLLMTEDQFGFKSKVKSSGNIGEQKTTPSTGVKQYNPATGKVE